VAGCSHGPSPEQAPPPKPAASTAERESVKVYDHDGTLVLRLKADKRGYKVYDSDDVLLARLKDYPDHIKVENEKRPLLRLKQRGKKFKTWVAENESTEVQFTYAPQDDGGYEIANGYGDLLYTVRHKDSGFDVLDAKGKAFCRMTIADGKVVATRADGFKLFEIHGSKSMKACSALVLDKFNIIARATLFAFLHHLENGDLDVGT
jgi:hypothetical protein